MATKLEQLQNQSTPEALRILALGGNPTESQTTRSAAFLQGLGGVGSIHFNDAQRAGARGNLTQQGLIQLERLNRQRSGAQDATEAAFEARGLGSGGLVERGILDTLQAVDDAEVDIILGNQRRSGGGGGGGSRSSAPRGPGGSPGPRSGAGPKPVGFDADLGLNLPDIEVPDIDADAVRNTLKQEQRAFDRTQQKGSLEVGAGPLLARQTQQRALSDAQTEFGTLGSNKSPARKQGESLDEFVNRSQQFNRDPGAMTRGELAGVTLQAMSKIKQGKTSLQTIYTDTQKEFEQNTQQDRNNLTMMQHMLQNLGQEQTMVVPGDERAGFRPLTPEEREARQTQLLNTMQTAARRIDHQRQQALAQAETARSRIGRNIITAQQRVKQFSAALDQKSAAKVRAGRAQAASRYDQLDSQLFQRLSRRFGQDPNGINKDSGLPNWKHLRTNMSQEEAQKAMMRFRQVGAGGLADPRQEFLDMVAQRKQAAQTKQTQSILSQLEAKKRAQEIIDKRNKAQQGVNRGQA